MQGRIRVPDLVLGGIDLLFGISFLTAFIRMTKETGTNN